MTDTPPKPQASASASGDQEGLVAELIKQLAPHAQKPVELVSTPSAASQVGSALVEFFSSKKALTMLTGNAVLLTAIDKAIAKHEQFAMVCVVGLVVLTAVYIASQAYVDAHKKN